MKPIPVNYTAEKWEPLKAVEPYSENFSHILDHDGLYFFCYWEPKRAGKEVKIAAMTFLIGNN